MPLFSVNIHRK